MALNWHRHGPLLGLLLILGLYCAVLASSTEETDSLTEKASEVQVVVLQPVENTMKFNRTEFTVKAGQKVRLVFENVATNEAMIHNVVILKPGSDIQKVGMAAIQAGPEKNYIPDAEEILFYTHLARPGETAQVEFIAPPPGEYPYLCSYPGHFVTMNGVMHSVK